MGFFDDIGKKVSDVGQKTLQKTKEVSDKVKINSQISDEEKKLENTYCQIGKLYVEKHTYDYEPEFAQMVQFVVETEKRIEEYKKQIQELKKTNTCPNCGAEVPKDNQFCSSCGTAIPQESNKIFCRNCGNPMEPGLKFCTNCGTQVGYMENESHTEETIKENDTECQESSNE